MIDCGADWRGRLKFVVPTAIVLTHAHPDHASGLVDGAPCPVYATRATWNLLSRYPIAERRVMPLRKSVNVGSVRFEAFPVEHSLRAPAVGYRISLERQRFFYVPDVADIPNAVNVLRRTDVYIGDGATIRRSMARPRNGTLIGHAPITAQLGWCARAGLSRAIFTHCGSQIVRGDARRTESVVRDLGRALGIDARIAYDGLMVPVR
jgi:phosphoribosyl 1,2-cyclic phosphodiesterase